LIPSVISNSSSSETSFFSSAATVVMILRFEPAGLGEEKAWPAYRPHVAGSWASRTATPPTRPASAATAVSCSRVDRRLHRGARLRLACAQDARVAAAPDRQQLPPLAREAAVKARSSR